MDEGAAYRGTSPPRHPVDTGRLAAWLAGHVPGFAGPVAVEQFRGGQSNPTYRLASPSGVYVLRRKPPGPLLPSAHAVDREFRVLRALAGTDVPVPRVHALCEDTAVIGSVFYVMEHVAGRIFWDMRLPGLAPDERAALFDSMNATLARLHRVDPAAVGLADFGRPDNYLPRQVARWTRQYRASETEALPAMDALIDWLPAHLPPQTETRVVHGDFRPDNLVVHPTEPRVVAVLDWELATLGDPLADFAYHLMAWRIPPDLFRGLAGADLAALGIPDERAYVAAYCRRTGRAAIPDLDVYLVYSLFRLAAIVQGIARRALDGTAASADAARIGRLAGPLAERAWALARSIAA
jgi:aminoglycoside phosphotransferase (APT) family kinase protein